MLIVLNSAQSAHDMLKTIKQGRGSVAEYIAKFDQYSTLTGWSNADHRQRFYNGLDNCVKDLFALSERPKATYLETRSLASDIDQRVQQRDAKKSGKPYLPDSNTGGGKGSRDPNAMEIDASKQDKGKEKKTQFTYLQSMKGRCFGCRSKDHTKKEGNHDRDVCNHCKKVGHRAPVCFTKYLGKPVATSAKATTEDSGEGTSAAVNATTSTAKPPAKKDKTTQGDILAQLMADMEKQKKELEALKSSF